MNWKFVGVFSYLTIVCLFVGCGSDFPAVSGKVTYDGKPIAGLQLVFNPTGDSVAPGPLSLGTTDESGEYSLVTRDGEQGAVAGLHKVGFDWSDIRSYTLRDLESALRDSKDNPARVAMLEAKIEEVKQKLASRPTLRANLQTEFTVPQGGTQEANFELTDF